MSIHKLKAKLATLAFRPDRAVRDGNGTKWIQIGDAYYYLRTDSLAWMPVQSLPHPQEPLDTVVNKCCFNVIGKWLTLLVGRPMGVFVAKVDKDSVRVIPGDDYAAILFRDLEIRFHPATPPDRIAEGMEKLSEILYSNEVNFGWCPREEVNKDVERWERSHGEGV